MCIAKTRQTTFEDHLRRVGVSFGERGRCLGADLSYGQVPLLIIAPDVVLPICILMLYLLQSCEVVHAQMCDQGFNGGVCWWKLKTGTVFLGRYL
jgi:hypothetical protein